MINKKYTRLFTVATIELATMLLSLAVIRLIYNILYPYIMNSSNSDVLTDIVSLSLFSIPIVACLLYMKKTYPGKLKIFTLGGVKKSASSLGIGLITGFVMNAVLCILAFVSGSLTFKFQNLDLRLLLLIIPCFIQCCAEEVLIRGYASSYLEDNYQSEVVAFVGGVLFIFHHIGNMTSYGFNSFFALNVFLIGIFLYYLMKLFGSIWICFGFHTAWNFTQEYIFGTPNSGQNACVSIFKGVDACDSIFFNTVFGNEGTFMCSVLILAGIFAVIHFYNKKTEIMADDDITPYSF